MHLILINFTNVFIIDVNSPDACLLYYYRIFLGALSYPLNRDIISFLCFFIQIAFFLEKIYDNYITRTRIKMTYVWTYIFLVLFLFERYGVWLATNCFFLNFLSYNYKFWEDVRGKFFINSRTFDSTDKKKYEKFASVIFDTYRSRFVTSKRHECIKWITIFFKLLIHEYF